MDATRDYTALAAECERRAAAGEEPELFDFDSRNPMDARIVDSSKSLEYIALELELTTNLEGVLFVRQHRMDSDGRLDSAGNLFLEDLLRDATKALHREAYVGRDTAQAMLNTTHGQIAEMCEYLGLKRDEVPCDAWQLRDALIRLRAECERLREAVEYAEHVFGEYAEMHSAKGNAEKAQRNRDHEVKMRDALQEPADA